MVSSLSLLRLHNLYVFYLVKIHKLIHIHWYDNHGNRDEHLPIGAGLIDHQKASKALKNIDCDRTITLEVFTNSNDAKSSADKLIMIWS
jgi:sugar phosphate isomerase/epimerase